MRRMPVPPAGHSCVSSNLQGVLAETHPTNPTKLQPSLAQDQTPSWIRVPRGNGLWHPLLHPAELRRQLLHPLLIGTHLHGPGTQVGRTGYPPGCESPGPRKAPRLAWQPPAAQWHGEAVPATQTLGFMLSPASATSSGCHSQACCLQAQWDRMHVQRCARHTAGTRLDRSSPELFGSIHQFPAWKVMPR